MSAKVFIALADSAIRDLLRLTCSRHYEVITKEEGISVIDMISRFEPDLVLLDNPGDCSTIRHHRPGIGMMVLSRDSHQSIAQILDQGADDYVRKPFCQSELEARMRALLRRRADAVSKAEAEPEILTSADGYISLDLARRQVSIGKWEVHLTPKEFALLRQLLLHSGKVLTQRFLLQSVWGPEYGEEADYVRVYVRQLRKKIEPDAAHPIYILTELGVGYILRGPSP